MYETQSVAKNNNQSEHHLAADSHGKIQHDGVPAELLDRIERGLNSRGYFVFGTDDLRAVWRDTSVNLGRETLLRNLAAALGADLQSGWTRNVALFLRDSSTN